MDDTDYFMIVDQELDGQAPNRRTLGPMKLDEFHATYDREVAEAHAQPESVATTIYAARIVYHERREPNGDVVVNPRRRKDARNPRQKKTL